MNRKNVRDNILSNSDRLFVSNLIENNAEYIKRIIHNTLGNVYKYLFDDAISEMHLLMCRKIEELKVHPSPKAWILVSAKRVAQGMIAKDRRHTSVPLDKAAEVADERNLEDTAIFEIWMDEKIPEKLIRRLSKRERQVYEKIYEEGKTPKETASDLNISLNAVHNIHKNLRDKIKDDVKRKNF